ncbi:MAG: prephenate dehydrogenase [Spirochaetaceae bacterium]|jgi:prephenate dehydrogenase|nr:prephenate dehydrogenase [Spirochaetaceae bacterium]
MKPIETCAVGIVGLGLMGGAFAKGLRRAGLAGAGLFACDKDAAVLAAALAAGDIDRAFRSPETMLPRCNLVILCVNPSTLLRFMGRFMDDFAPDTLITDIAGVKSAIAAAMERDLRPDIDFIPGHPMAGSEKGGYAHAASCDFRGRNYILTPLRRNKPENLAFLKDLIARLGFGRITETTAAAHDRNVAFTSQLSHVIAAALIDCETDVSITRFGGGSFEDLTRIAMLNAPMWTEIFLENRRELLDRIRQFRGSLDRLEDLIRKEDSEGLERTLQNVRERRSRMTC